jgi:hypothetical protein
MADGRGTAVAGIISAAVLAACLLVPGMRLGADRPWLGAAIMIVPVAALLTGTGYRHYGLGRAVAVALAVTLMAGVVSWLVAVFTLVKALSGAGIEAVWAILLFATPVISVLALGAVGLRILPARHSSGSASADSGRRTAP